MECPPRSRGSGLPGQLRGGGERPQVRGKNLRIWATSPLAIQSLSPAGGASTGPACTSGQPEARLTHFPDEPALTKDCPQPYGDGGCFSAGGASGAGAAGPRSSSASSWSSSSVRRRFQAGGLFSSPNSAFVSSVAFSSAARAAPGQAASSRRLPAVTPRDRAAPSLRWLAMLPHDVSPTGTCPTSKDREAVRRRRLMPVRFWFGTPTGSLTQRACEPQTCSYVIHLGPVASGVTSRHALPGCVAIQLQPASTCVVDPTWRPCCERSSLFPLQALAGPVPH
jgi:hypothetical protein